MANDKNFAIIKVKNNQYKVSEGEIVDMDRMDGEAGEKLTFDEVLLKSNSGKVEIGKPTIEKATVTAEIVEQTKGKKVTTSTYKAKARTRRKVGQRPKLTRIKINKIN
ncbi:50S ribosomal protein L21 [Candidatus Dojkabacteria bacterium]|uniref:Large ribosomal subunit protein bL21 n=1 Tax=Candidatus Dojkabacteria bacterium TaxID=2099670 RepID=A0A955L625_9BACT|nr:50S ribosomal protein L21 [Candidatus Dojkabacteria bacterium]